MQVVLPFCNKDEELALRQLEWSKKLDGTKVPYRCIVVHDSDTAASRIIDAASEVFESIAEYEYGKWEGKPDWPFPQNFQFQSLAMHIQSTPGLHDAWFWWEPDATPLKPGWISTLEKAHIEGDKPFSGHQVGEPFNHMTGVGIYPWDTPNRAPNAMLALKVPWDVASKNNVIGRQFHRINHLIQHIWERNGRPFSFETKQEALDVLSDTAVIFHRCKDGSLIDVLNGTPIQTKLRKFFGIKPSGSPPETVFVVLGRYGDIANALPLAYYQWKVDGAKPAWIVQKDCASILEGVNYVEPIIYDGHYSEVERAVELHGRRFKRVIIPQMYGNHAVKDHSMSSFAVEMWRHTNLITHWGKIPLVFDNRSDRREKALASQYLVPERRNILVNLSGLSSPFQFRDAVMMDIERRWSAMFNIVDLSKINAERIYDLLGLYDRSDLLITTDTATLHLARASKIPYFAFVTDKPNTWYGAPTHGNCIGSLRYAEAILRREEMHDAIDSCREASRPLFLHVHPDFDGSGDTLRRNTLARQSWQVPYSMGCVRAIEVHDDQLPRMWMLDDGKRLPFLKDVVESAYWRCGEQDYILLTNSDTCFASDIFDVLKIEMNKASCVYARRRDFPRLDKLLENEEIVTGHSYPGKDLFCFRKSWWEENRNKMPDMIYGAEGWDALLAILFEESGATVLTDIIYHERHGSYWEKPENRYSVPSQIHCLKLAKAFCREHNRNPEDYGFK
jgi:hypothetical protein